MGPKVQQKTKEQKMAAAMAGAKAKKKKWNKGKAREKINSKVLFDEDGWARLHAEVPKMKVITPSALVERLKINTSLARAACKFLVSEDKIAAVSVHHKQKIYTRAAV
jgi:small subunit ribosomal protein S25e